MLRFVCGMILLFVTPWNTWAADLPNPARTLGSRLATDLTSVSLPSTDPGSG